MKTFIPLLLLMLLPQLRIHSQVTEEWIKDYDNSFGQDIAYALAIDDSGNAYITGSSWDGSITQENYVTIKYNAQGIQQWLKEYDNSFGPDMARAIAVDDSGNVYITGSSWDGSITQENYVTIKYNAQGAVQWLREYDNSFGPDIARAIAVDDSGNVYITGSSWDGSITQENYVTIKYNAAGAQQWLREYDNSFGPDMARALAVDDSGNVYITGSSWDGSITHENYVTIKYNAAGAQQWLREYDHNFGPDIAYALALSDSGYVYITGSGWDGSITEENYLTIKYNSAGTQQWLVDYDLNFGPDIARAIAIDDSDNVHITGSGWDGSITEENYLTIQYNSAGVQQWLVNDDENFGPDIARAITLDSSGNVYITGSAWDGSISEEDYLTIQYDNAGVMQWRKDHDESFGPDIAYDIAVSPHTGAVYVTGSGWDGSISVEDYITIKYCKQPGISLNADTFSICHGDTVQLSASGGTTYNWSPATGLSNPNIANPLAYPGTTQNYTVTVTNANGCSSTAHVAVIVHPTSLVIEYVSECNGAMHTFPDGTTANVDTSHISLLQSTFGCDSTIVSFLTMHQSSFSSISPTACDSYTSPGGQVWTSSGTYQDTIANGWGCDSIMTIQLTVLQSTTNILNPAPVCGSYTAPSGQVITNSGTYTDIIPNSIGCDSVITINTVIYPEYYLNANASTCFGTPYTFPDGSTSSTGTVHTSQLQTINGCDSNITTTLTTTPLPSAAVSVSGGTVSANLNNATYQWIDCNNGNQVIPGANGQSYTPSLNGSYAVIVTKNGCSDTSVCTAFNSVGIPENNVTPNVSVYPNPTNALCFVEFNEIQEQVEIKIFDVTGKEIYSTEKNQTGFFPLEINTFPSGVYFISIKTPNIQEIVKLVKTRS